MFDSKADSFVTLIPDSPLYAATGRRHVDLTSHRRRNQRLLVLLQQADGRRQVACRAVRRRASTVQIRQERPLLL